MGEDSKNISHIVCVGASAGGLEALIAFVSVLDASFPAPIVIAQHLSPTHRSLLTPLIQRSSKIPIREIKDGDALLPGTVFITPENADASIDGDRIHLRPIGGKPGPHPSVNNLFASAADSWGLGAIGIVFSGTGSDGSLGAAKIDDAGGLVLVQDEDSAKYWSMPKSVIDAGFARSIAPPEIIANQVIEYVTQGEFKDPTPDTTDDSALADILRYAEQHLAFSISNYKSPTVMRRIGSRMAALGCRDLEQYSEVFQSDPLEGANLIQALLIPVTSFFRDSDAFDALRKTLEAHLPETIERRGQFRVWVPGCCTGEEAYSIAMIIDEICREADLDAPINIFATDLSEVFVDRARKGFYSMEQVVDLSPERLDRHFERVANGYRVVQRLRDRIVFANHDILRSTPFLHIDLLSCRNLLIYFQQTAQQSALRTISSALELNGLLFLGRSETCGEAERLYDEVSRKARIYRKMDDDVRGGVPADRLADRAAGGRLGPPFRASRPLRQSRARTNQDLLHWEIVQKAPPTFLVNRDDVVENVAGDTKNLVHIATGPYSGSLFALIPEALQLQTRVALAEARRDGETKETSAVRISAEGQETVWWKIKAHPLEGDVARHMVVVTFERQIVPHKSTDKSDYQEGLNAEFNEATTEIYQELADTRAHLKTVIEELEVANEELQAANEELLSSNEEFQATNEELETANEELQATNEELETVNDELSVKNAEVGELNADLLGVLESISSPIFVFDTNDNLKSANSAAATFYRGLTGDPALTSLMELIDAVEEPRLLRHFRKIAKDGGRATPLTLAVGKKSYSVQMSIWRDKSHDGRIAAKVVLLQDITDLVKATESVEAQNRALSISEFRQHAILDGVDEHLALVDQTGTIIAVNSSWAKFAALNSGDPARTGVGVNYLQVCRNAAGACSEEAWGVADMIETALREPDYRKSMEYPCHSPGEERWFNCTVSSFHHEDARYAVVVHSNITSLRTTSDGLKSALDEKETLIQEIHHRVKNNLQVIASLMHLQKETIESVDGKRIISDMQRRVEVMAQLYATLYESDNLLLVDMREYLQSVLDNAVYFAGGLSDGIEVALSIDDIELEMKRAMTCAQIMSELVSNCLKHAFPDGKGTISVSFARAEDGRLRLSVADDGIGLPDGFDETRCKSLGIRLIGALVTQLGGTKETVVSKGTRVSIEFGENKK
ncbi:MAG: ATP-binding protein [Alphaproteobacteria bacterium]|nr:ATP-binding protein [Alphaproteobacteria bacterium]